MARVSMALPSGAVVVPVDQADKTHYFLVDTGVLKSFSSELDALHDQRLLPDGAPAFPLAEPLFDITQLSEVLGCPLSGFLGMDYLEQFGTVGFDQAGRELLLDEPSPDGEVLLFGGRQQSGLLLVEVEVDGVRAVCLVDTGSWQCLMPAPPTAATPASLGWRLPTPGGAMVFDFYPGVSYLAGELQVRCAAGVLRDRRLGPFDGVLGRSFLGQHTVCFDLARSRMVLAPAADAPTSPGPLQLDPDLHWAGLQVVLRSGRLTVDAILPGSANSSRVTVGDELEIPDLDMANPELMNHVHHHLSSHRPATAEVLLNGKKVALDLTPLFV